MTGGDGAASGVVYTVMPVLVLRRVRRFAPFGAAACTLAFTLACAPASRATSGAALPPLPEPPAESPLPGDPRSAEVGAPGASGEAAAAEFGELRGRGLMVPVAGITLAQLSDGYDAPREGGRRHEAIDILAPRGTPVLAVDDGIIVRVGTNALGGNVVWETDSKRLFAYYYAHLDRYARGLREGQDVRRGAVLGYVGTTGNASPGTPHLHFQAMHIRDARRFSDGPPFNPLSYFTLPGTVP